MNTEMNTEGMTLSNVITEKELLEMFGLTSVQLSRLRYDKQLPFVKLNAKKRLYFEKDIITFFASQRMILNQDDNDTL
jgi:transcriptional regulator with XRE-family HTH domain